jgi:hypothetical protein
MRILQEETDIQPARIERVKKTACARGDERRSQQNISYKDKEKEHTEIHKLPRTPFAN